LALLQKLLLSWKPDQQHLQAVLDLLVPLLVADRQQLLTTTEAAALRDMTGEHVLQTVIGISAVPNRL
jgi:hypothetical protein